MFSGWLKEAAIAGLAAKQALESIKHPSAMYLVVGMGRDRTIEISLMSMQQLSGSS